LLGRLGGDSIHLIGAVNLAAAGTESEMAWDTVPRVKFAVPFHDMKSEIYLDALLPRIVELAENASERQTKVAACELLHAVVLYMVGTNAHSSRRDEDGPVRLCACACAV
jgi:DNA-dependent protein kinase catalytic subunit